MIDLTRETRVVDLFFDLAETLVDDYDVNYFLQKLSAHCVECLDIDAAGVMLIAPSGNLRIIAASDESIDLVDLFTLQAHQGPYPAMGRAAQPRLNVDLTDVAAKTMCPSFIARARAHGYTRVHVLPMRVRSSSVGVLSLLQAGSHDIAPTAVSLAQAIADVATLGVLRQHRLEQGLLDSLQMQATLASRATIEQVKGILAQRWDCSIDDAFAFFRRYSLDSGVEQAELAARIINGAQDTDVIPR
ncbi:ANTAR domain-containing protein [Streptomyces sp. NPDC001941]|uniref:ANTAR domain-containing protein n=1 Tax=Streptomyces sp. NPDC001941 TaxID=3154659 RepID=UPI00332E07DB